MGRHSAGRKTSDTGTCHRPSSQQSSGLVATFCICALVHSPRSCHCLNFLAQSVLRTLGVLPSGQFNAKELETLSPRVEVVLGQPHDDDLGNHT